MDGSYKKPPSAIYIGSDTENQDLDKLIDQLESAFTGDGTDKIEVIKYTKKSSDFDEFLKSRDYLD